MKERARAYEKVNFLTLNYLRLRIELYVLIVQRIPMGVKEIVLYVCLEMWPKPVKE